LTKTLTDTIVARATPAGRGGIAVTRISGSLVPAIATAMLKKMPTPRHAMFSSFYNAEKIPLDEGVAIFYPGPNTATGEDVLELQGHASPAVVDMVIREVLKNRARMARPGEFSERSFLNDKLDLAQAEAIADLIDASSEQAARSALRSLQGEFSRQIHTLVEAIIHVRQ
jgi:tRNA modification GTPase